jgi:hypothetical protein
MAPHVKTINGDNKEKIAKKTPGLGPGAVCKVL